jgi:hypothetical protein
VDDHIGALAISTQENRLYGASWDTRQVYVWDLDGNVLRRLKSAQLRQARLGLEPGATARSGLAVQDWKIEGNELVAVGLLKGVGLPDRSARSRLFILDPSFKQAPRVIVPRSAKAPALEMGREGMAVAENKLYLLPEDLGVRNRVFVVPFSVDAWTDSD